MDNMEEGEKNSFYHLKWWSLKELEDTEEEFEPGEQILNLLSQQ